MGQSAGADDNDGTAEPNFDEAWIKAAKRSEPEIRRYQIPPPKHVPAPWRTWTPPEQREPTTPVRYPPQRRSSRRPGLVGGLLALLGLIVLGALALQVFPASDGANDRTNPAASDPAIPPNGGGPAVVSATTLATPAMRPTAPAAAPVARPVPWTLATAMPPPGPDATRAEVFRTIKVGACLAETPDCAPSPSCRALVRIPTRSRSCAT